MVHLIMPSIKCNDNFCQCQRTNTACIWITSTNFLLNFLGNANMHKSENLSVCKKKHFDTL